VHESRLDRQRSAVSLTVADGVATREGEVAPSAATKLALELAAAVPGVEGLGDRLRVAPSVAMRDVAIRDHVRDALAQESA
jgi:osmotically-inducible protein OsmY